MPPSEQLELASERSEAAGLDLHQEVAADQIDDETVDELLDAIARASVPVLELSVQRTLVERPDRRYLTFVGCLKDGAHDDAPSASPQDCLRQVKDWAQRRVPCLPAKHASCCSNTISSRSLTTSLADF